MAESQPPLPQKGMRERFSQWRADHKVGARFERFHPYVLALVAAVLVCRAGLAATHVEKLLDVVVPVAVSVAAVLAGFQAAAQSVMIALIDSPAVKFLRSTGHYNPLIDFHWDTILSLLLFIAAAIGFLVLKAVGVDITAHTKAVPASLVFLFVWSGLSSVRIMRLMVKILRDKNPEAA